MMSAGAWAEPIPDYGSIIRQIEGKVKRFFNRIAGAASPAPKSRTGAQDVTGRGGKASFRNREEPAQADEIREKIMEEATKCALERLLRAGWRTSCEYCVYCAGSEDAALIAEYGCPEAAEGGCIEGIMEYFEEHKGA